MGAASLGVRDHVTLGTELALVDESALAGYARLTATFDVPDWTLMDLYIGMRTDDETAWMELDDVTLQKAAPSCP